MAGVVWYILKNFIELPLANYWQHVDKYETRDICMPLISCNFDSLKFFLSSGKKAKNNLSITDMKQLLGSAY